MRKKVRRYLLLIPVFLLIILFFYHKYDEIRYKPVYIAVAGPFEANSLIGRSYLNGIRLYIDRVNSRNYLNGRKVLLDIYDDQNNSVVAAEMAETIAKDSKAVAVIGHHYSQCSIAAGKIYKKYGVPAISPSSTHVNVTKNNPWYFRTVFNDRLQGRFLANYSTKIFHHKTGSIIYDEHDYGIYLAKVFKNEAKALGMEIKYQWGYNSEDPDLHVKLRRIATQVQMNNDAGLIFLATHAKEGGQLVRIMRDMFIRNPIMAPDTYATNAFIKKMSEYPKEKRNPGYYTNGIYVGTPMGFDTASESAHGFEEAYIARYGEKPDWIAAYAFDTAMLIIKAIKSTEIAEKEDMNIRMARQRIRDYLAGLNNIDTAIKGITGYNYFNEDGDAVKPIFFGIFKKGNIISAFTQLMPVYNIHHVLDFTQKVKDKRIILFNGQYMYKTNVVQAGININEIKELDIEKQSCTMDFYIWLRYKGDMDVENIKFINALEPVELGRPVNVAEKDQMMMRLYHVKGKFKMDFMPTKYAFGYHFAGIQLRHNELSRNNLIFMPDIIGMGLTGSKSDIIRTFDNIFRTESKWKVDNIRAFQDSVKNSTFFRLKSFGLIEHESEFSRFNYGIRIKKAGFTLRGKDFENINEEYCLLFSAIILTILGFIKKNRFSPLVHRLIWVFQVIFSLILLLFAETIIVAGLLDNELYAYQPVIARCFDILWWVVPAFLLKMATESFIWRAMEKHTGRSVPGVMRRFTSYVIYFIALYGIIVFVFKTNITSLMATSGVIAMIIGFIIKANISNFFSGMVINQGNAVRTGDWIKVGSLGEGKVEDITWRSTKLRTKEGCLLSIPNSTVSESPVYNFYYPNRVYRMDFTINLPPNYKPGYVKRILYDAVVSAECVLNRPAPVIRFTGINGGKAEYSISFSVPDYEKKGEYYEEVWNRIWNQLKFSHIKLSGQSDEDMAKCLIDPDLMMTPKQVLDSVEIFSLFSDETKHELAGKMKSHTYPPDKPIVKQGEKGESMFIVARGVVSVWVSFQEDEPAYEIARMGPGSIFGEMALLTGQPRYATIIPITKTDVYEITKEDIYAHIESQPQILEKLSEILAARKKIIDIKKSQTKKLSQDRRKRALSKTILGKIKQTFGMT